MREQTIIKALEMHDRGINGLTAELRTMQKVLDRTYVQSLTHVMMWDVLMGLLESKGVMTKTQFDEALKELSAKTKAAMDADKAKAEETPVDGVSNAPAIPVVG